MVHKMRRKENHFPPPGWQHQTPIIQTEARKRTGTAAADQEPTRPIEPLSNSDDPNQHRAGAATKPRISPAMTDPDPAPTSPAGGAAAGASPPPSSLIFLGTGCSGALPRRAVPHPAVRAAVRRLLHGPLPAAGQEPQLQVRAALLWIGQPLFNETILFRTDLP